MNTLMQTVEVAQRMGALGAVIRASRFLRANGHREAASLLLAHTEQITPEPECVIPPDDEPQPDALPELPDSWPFPNSGEGEL